MARSEQTGARRRREGSFTLIETVIALGIVAFLIVEVAIVQGNAIVFADYNRNITQATWLARRVLSWVEYYWETKPFKELKAHVVDQKFEDFDEYSYSLEIAEWKFPFIKLLQEALGGGKGKRDKDKDSFEAREKKVDTSGAGDMVETVVKQIFGDEPIFLTAHVDVSWPEGAQRNSVGMTYLLTNQAKLDEALASLKSVYDRLTKPPAPKKAPGANVAPGQPALPQPDGGGGPDQPPPPPPNLPNPDGGD